MTNKAALIAVLHGIQVPDDSLEKAMTDNDVTGSGNYVKVNAKAIDLCAIDVLQGILSEPDVQEGDYSIQYDRNAIRARLDYLNEKNDLTSSAPTITSKPVW